MKVFYKRILWGEIFNVKVVRAVLLHYLNTEPQVFSQTLQREDTGRLPSIHWCGIVIFWNSLKHRISFSAHFYPSKKIQQDGLLRKTFLVVVFFILFRQSFDVYSFDVLFFSFQMNRISVNLYFSNIQTILWIFFYLLFSVFTFYIYKENFNYCKQT